MIEKKQFQIEAVFDAVFAAFFSIKRRGRRLLSDMESEFTLEQVIVLNIIGRTEGLNMGELAELADRDKTTTSRMVSGLEKRDLVVRIPDKQDSRQKLIYLTHRGKKKISEMEKLRTVLDKKAYRGIRAKDLKFCQRILEALIANLNES